MPAFYLPLIGRSLSWWTYGMALKTVRALFANCDAVLASWLYPDAVAAAEMARRHGKPYWIKVHGTDRFHLLHRGRRRRILDCCEKARGVICNCRFLADELAAMGVEREKIHVVPNGVDAELFRWRSREEARRQLSGVSDQLSVISGGGAGARIHSVKLVLFVGNLAPVKGPDTMLEAWALFQRGTRNAERGKRNVEGSDNATATLLIVGDGPMRRRLERRAADLGVSDSVVFLGSRPHDEIALWMNAADCLCLTSRSEGMPNVVLEALASGLPVVATDVGACSELLADEPATRVVRGEGVRSQESGVRKDRSGFGKSQDIETVYGIAAALREVLGMTVDRKAMAQRRAGRVSWQKSAESLLAVIGACR